MTVSFDYDGEVTGRDAEEILHGVAGLYGRSLEAAERATTPARADALRIFAVADPGGNLLLPNGAHGFAAVARQQSAEVSGTSGFPA